MFSIAADVLMIIWKILQVFRAGDGVVLIIPLMIVWLLFCPISLFVLGAVYKSQTTGNAQEMAHYMYQVSLYVIAVDAGCIGLACCIKCLSKCCR